MYGRQERSIQGIFVGKLRERENVEDLGVDGRKCKGIWTEFKNLSEKGRRYVAGCFDDGNEILFS